MRAAVYYDLLPQTGFRNDGNPCYVTQSLKRRGIECDILAPNETIKHFGKYDLNIVVDWGEDALRSIIPYEVKYPTPYIYWASDTHINNGKEGDSYPYRLETARKAAIVFCAQKRAIEEFRRDGVHAEWLPHAFEPWAYHDIESGKPVPFNYASKDYDVSFVGHVNSDNRIDFLDRMFKEFPNFFWGQRRFQDAAKIYCKSKISLNISMTDDVNMRNYEIAGSGGCLLTNWLPTIEELGFEDGKTCLLYKSLEEASDKTNYYLKHDSEREKIAQTGLELCLERHTIDKRVDRMLEVAKNFVENKEKVEA